jgi:hypothetical protein
MNRRKEPRRSVVTPDGYQRITRFMNEAFDDYVTGLVALRKRVVADLKRKLSRLPRNRTVGATASPDVGRRSRR